MGAERPEARRPVRIAVGRPCTGTPWGSGLRAMGAESWWVKGWDAVNWEARLRTQGLGH